MQLRFAERPRRLVNTTFLTICNLPGNPPTIIMWY